MRRSAAIAKLRCPRCREGKVWSGALTMNETCPTCDLRFEREPGYFTGAMLVSYLIAVPIFTVLWLALWLVVGWDILPALIVATVVFLFLVPMIFRYSRVLWMHFDQAVDPEKR
jgi:uncharacterized protein (DUF983 family)